MAHWLAFASFAIRSALAFHANFATCAYERADAFCFAASADSTWGAAPALDEPPKSRVSAQEELDPCAA